MARKRRYAAAKAVARHADQLSATPVSIENSQGSAASPRKRRGLRGPTLPKPEDQSEMDPDSFRERKRPPSVEGFWDDRGIQTQVPDNDEAHDAKLSSDFAPVTTDQGWDVASLVDYRSHTDRQVGEVPGVTASFPDKADAASGDHARPTVRQILSHQAVLQARIQRSSAQKRPCSRQLRSPISISFAPDTKTHRISGRRRRRRSGKGKPECNRRYKAAVAHVGYPPPSGLDWFTDGKQAARTERPPERQGIVPSGVHDSLIPCYAGQTDHYAARVGDQTSHGPNRELPPSQPPPPGTEQPRANHWYGSSVTSAPRAMEENSRRLPPIRNLGHAFSTPVLANVQPQPPEGGPPPGYQNVMHHGRHHAELLNSRAPPGSLGPRSQAHLQHMRPHQICTPNLSCALWSASAPVGSWQQYTTAVFIEDDVLIGGNVAILPGCTIGKGSAVEAGSVVTNDVPPFTFVSGNPARVLGDNVTYAL